MVDTKQIAVSKEVHKRLEKRKQHPRQSYNEVIENLLNDIDEVDLHA